MRTRGFTGNRCHGPGALRDKSRRIDLGLSILSTLLIPGEGLSSEDIAAWCGCSHQAIQRIEYKALQKLRVRLGADQLETIADIFLRDRRPALSSQGAPRIIRELNS